MEDRGKWYRLTSSLDVIGDSTSAAKSYVESDFPEDDGLKYLSIYGLLQALILQQDATKHTANSLNIEHKRSNFLESVRSLRNDAAGHPTDRDHGHSFHYISRMTMKKWTFQLLSSYIEDNSSNFRDVDLMETVEKQQLEIRGLLQNLVDELSEEINAHFFKYSTQKLIEKPESLNYFIDCIVQGIEIDERKGQAEIGIRGLQKFYQSSVEKLKARLEWNDERPLTEDFREARHCLEKIARLLGELRDPKKRIGSRVFIRALRNAHKDICDVLKEIDENYLNMS